MDYEVTSLFTKLLIVFEQTSESHERLHLLFGSRTTHGATSRGGSHGGHGGVHVRGGCIDRSDAFGPHQVVHVSIMPTQFGTTTTTTEWMLFDATGMHHGGMVGPEALVDRIVRIMVLIVVAVQHAPSAPCGGASPHLAHTIHRVGPSDPTRVLEAAAPRGRRSRGGPVVPRQCPSDAWPSFVVGSGDSELILVVGRHAVFIVMLGHGIACGHSCR